MNSKFNIEKLLEKYNNPTFAFAYGSKVFKQLSYESHKNSMIDLIFAVDLPIEWHKGNIKKNPKDYSFLARRSGSKIISKIQESGAGIYYNPFVQFGDLKIKYGIISIEDTIEDLENWKSLYVAGRMQKPIKIIKPNNRIENAIQKNLEHAINVAMLLLPEKFSEKKLYTTIANLSYMGDTRMGIAEDSDKVKNIVYATMNKFGKLYKNLLEQDNNMTTDNKILSQNISRTVREDRIEKLPKNLRNKFYEKSRTKLSIQEKIEYSIKEIVQSSSMTQTIKGVFSAGLIKSLYYLQEKRKKIRTS